MFKLRVWVLSLGSFCVLAFVQFLIWDRALAGHAQIYEIARVVLPGFDSHTIRGVLLGIMDSFLWGAYAALLFVPIHNYYYAIRHRAEVKRRLRPELGVKGNG